jgi:hypothetical protein
VGQSLEAGSRVGIGLLGMADISGDISHGTHAVPLRGKK